MRNFGWTVIFSYFLLWTKTCYQPGRLYYAQALFSAVVMWLVLQTPSCIRSNRTWVGMKECLINNKWFLSGIHCRLLSLKGEFTCWHASVEAVMENCVCLSVYSPWKGVLWNLHHQFSSLGNNNERDLFASRISSVGLKLVIYQLDLLWTLLTLRGWCLLFLFLEPMLYNFYRCGWVKWPYLSCTEVPNFKNELTF